MAIKKYTSGAWVPTSYRKYGTEADTITSLPAQIIGDGQPITSCQISGNTLQDGTPSPSDPVDVVGCGAWDETQQSYKLPLTVNGTEHPIYLGHVETTRRIKKLVLTGNEAWVEWNGNFYSNVIDNTALKSSKCFCSHFINNNSKGINVGADASRLKIASVAIIDVAQDVTSLKMWLSAQYANGTPVTVWYILATPETGIVNEPLMKIGDYADTVSATNIPTTGTAEQFDIQTTLKPSEVSLTYHGWHEHTNTKYTE